MPEIKIEAHEDTELAELCRVIEAAAPGEGLWWVFIQEFIVPGRRIPEIGLIPELRRLKQSKEGKAA